jgi:peptidoglycan/xylan/chitin deacetylase (PgdA/CDA1 family)
MAKTTISPRPRSGPEPEPGHLARAEQMRREVFGASDEHPAHRGPAMSRRVLFAAAGVTLLSGCGATGAGGPDAGRGKVATGVPGIASLSPTPADRRPSPPATSAGPSPLPIATEPQFYVHAGPKAIALTLDDGPSRYTPQILEILRTHRITATFCMIGCQTAANASVVREVAAAGHLIANHTWDHPDLSRLALGRVNTQIARTTDALTRLGVEPTMFRAPYGAWSHTVFEAAAAAGLRPLDWSVDPQDWARPGTESIVSSIIRTTRTGSIILDHDGGGDRSQTVAAMRIWLPHLLDQGYRFTTP